MEKYRPSVDDDFEGDSPRQENRDAFKRSRFDMEAMQMELEHLKETDPKKYEEAKKEMEEVTRGLNSPEFREAMANMSNFFAGLAGLAGGMRMNQKDADYRDRKEVFTKETNPFKEFDADIDLDPSVISFLFSLDGVGFNDYSMSNIEPDFTNPPERKQWDISTSPFKAYPDLYNKFFKVCFKLDKDTADFYK